MWRNHYKREDLRPPVWPLTMPCISDRMRVRAYRHLKTVGLTESGLYEPLVFVWHFCMKLLNWKLPEKEELWLWQNDVKILFHGADAAVALDHYNRKRRHLLLFSIDYGNTQMLQLHLITTTGKDDISYFLSTMVIRICCSCTWSLQQKKTTFAIFIDYGITMILTVWWTVPDNIILKITNYCFMKKISPSN